MKKIYQSILFAIIAAAGFTACSDYDAPDTNIGHVVKVLSHETSFPASASTGSIKIEAAGPVSVTTSSQWLTASVDGNTINIAVEQNNSLNGRAATVNVKCGNATDEISVIQAGVIFKFDTDKFSFESDATTLSYPIDANAPVEVSTDADWVKAEIVDGVLQITTEANPTLDPRSATVIIKCGDSVYEIPVEQKELVFPLFKVKSLNISDDKVVKTYEFKADIPVTFASDAAWIHGEFANGIVTVTIDANETGHMRSGTLEYEVAGQKGSLDVFQVEFEKDIAGAYLLFFTNGSTGKQSAFNATFKKTGSEYAIDLPDLNFSIPVSWNNNTLVLTLGAGDFIGDWVDEYGAAYIFTLFGFTKDGKSMVTAGGSMTAEFVYFEQAGKGYTIAPFKDAGAYSYPLSSLILAGFTTPEFDFEGYDFNLISMSNLQLQKSHVITSASTSLNTPIKKSESYRPHTDKFTSIIRTLSRDSNIFAY